MERTVWKRLEKEGKERGKGKHGKHGPPLPVHGHAIAFNPNKNTTPAVVLSNTGTVFIRIKGGGRDSVRGKGGGGRFAERRVITSPNNGGRSLLSNRAVQETTHLELLFRFRGISLLINRSPLPSLPMTNVPSNLCRVVVIRRNGRSVMRFFPRKLKSFLRAPRGNGRESDGGISGGIEGDRGEVGRKGGGGGGSSGR